MKEKDEIYYLAEFFAHRTGNMLHPDGFQAHILLEEEEFYLKGGREVLGELERSVLTKAKAKGWRIDSVAIELVVGFDEMIGEHYVLEAHAV